MNPLPEPVVLALSRLRDKAPDDVELVRLHIQAMQSQEALSELLATQVDALEKMSRTLDRLEPIITAGTKALELQSQTNALSQAAAGKWAAAVTSIASHPVVLSVGTSVATLILTALAIWLGLPPPANNNFRSPPHVSTPVTQPAGPEPTP